MHGKQYAARVEYNVHEMQGMGQAEHFGGIKTGQARSVDSIKTERYYSCYGIVSLEHQSTTIVKSSVVKVKIRRQAGIIN
jgi:hypothetical protein